MTRAKNVFAVACLALLISAALPQVNAHIRHMGGPLKSKLVKYGLIDASGNSLAGAGDMLADGTVPMTGDLTAVNITSASGDMELQSASGGIALIISELGIECPEIAVLDSARSETCLSQYFELYHTEAGAKAKTNSLRSGIWYSSQFALAAATPLGWSSNAAGSADAAGNNDTIFQRSAAGQLDLNSSSGGNGNGTLRAQVLTGNGAGIASGYLVPAENFTASDTLTQAESGKLCTNLGDGDTLVLTLPDAPNVGTTYVVWVADAFEVRVTPNTGDTLTYSGGTMAAAEYLTSSTVGSTLRLTAISATRWVAEDAGTWAEETP